MPWTPLPRLAFAICVYPFVPSAPADLPLQIGDELYIIEQGGRDGTWYRGYLVAPPSLLAGLTSTKGQTLEKRVFTGIFPRDCVEVRELLGDTTRQRRPLDRSTGQGEPDAAGQVDGVLREHRHSSGLTETDADGSGKPNGAAETHSENDSFKPRLLRPDSSGPPEDGFNVTQDPKMSVDTISTTISHASLPQGSVATAPSTDLSSRPPAPVPMLKIGDESALTKHEPLVDEIASCLREWHSSKLHDLLLGRKYGALEQLAVLVTRLDYARRQLLHKVLTQHELHALRDSAVWDLVSGNKVLGGDTIVRSTAARGRIMTSDDSAVEVSRLQSIMSLLDERPSSQPERSALHHLLVDLKGFVLSTPKPSTITLSMYRAASGGPPQLITEPYTVEVLPRDPGGFSFDGPPRTLFTDISGADVGEGPNDNPNIYLVIRLVTSEPTLASEGVESESRSINEGHSRHGSSSNNSTWRTTSTKSGRRSLMWSHTARKDSENNILAPPSRPETSQSRVSSPRSSASPSQAKKVKKTVKRLTGVGIVEVRDTLRSLQDCDQSVDIASPQTINRDVSEIHRVWKEVVSLVIGETASHSSQGIQGCALSMHLKAFKSPDSEALIQSTPTLLHGVTSSRRNAFSGAPMRPRSDIYLTVERPSLPQNAYLSHPQTGSQPVPDENGMKNLQLTLEVRNASGERIENCLFPSSSSIGHTAWRTVAIEREESWNQAVRLAIDTEDVPGSHIVMSVADAPNFPFALCWVPLWTRGAFVRDGGHSLAMYKYDEHTSGTVSGQGAYLALPWSTSKLKDESVTGPIASVRISTHLCSTSYSQDPNLLALLKWREQKTKDVNEILRQFPFVPDVEIVKLINEVLDSLFEILVEHADNEELEDLVFNALLMLLSIAQDRRFNLQSSIDQYTATRFRWPFAFPCLFRSFTRLLNDPSNAESARKLRLACKVGAYIFKFIIRARQQQIEKEVDIGIRSHPPTFAKDLRGIFMATEELMRSKNPVLVGTKTIVVQNFHTWLPQLSGVTSADETLQLATGFIDACSEVQGKLILYKLVLIRNLSAADLFNSDSLGVWQRKVSIWLSQHWGLSNSYTQQWREQVRLCCSIVSSLFDKRVPQTTLWIGKFVESYKAVQMIPQEPGRPFSLLFPTIYPFPAKATRSKEKFDEALIEISALLSASFATLPSDAFFDVPDDQLQDQLSDTLAICRSILRYDAFPRSWLSLLIYHHKSVFRVLEPTFDILCKKFLPDLDDADSFNDSLWKSYLSVLLTLVGSDALALETFPEQKRRAVWKIGGDIRELGAALLHRSWFTLGWDTSPEEKNRFGLDKMGGYQVSYVPALVGPILELCLSVHEGLRGVAIGVLYTMIVSEWSLNEDLGAIQTEMISNLDRIYREKQLNDGMMQKQFIEELSLRIEPLRDGSEKGFFGAVSGLLDKTSELLDLLVAVYLPEAAGDSLQASDTLRLLDYLRHMGKTDIYISYVHKLAAAQVESKHPTEAALALKMHACLYSWESADQLEAMRDPAFPKHSSFERREQIYFDMIRHFEDGCAWKHALEAYSDLAKQYEYDVYDFAKLARTRRSMATIYETIGRSDRQSPRYFRVMYRGLGFPPSLRDRQYIFEGLPGDRLGSFTDRMQQQYPSAQVVGGAPLDEIEGQYLSIYSISVQKDYAHPVNRRARVSPSIKDHYTLSSPTQFSVTSRRQGKSSGIKDQSQDKIVYTTAEAFPNILRRSEVVNVETLHMTPLQIGLDRTNRKTQELQSTASAISQGRDTATTGLTENLMNLVNAKSAACVSGYWELISESMKSKDEYLTPEQQALRAALVDHVLAVRRCLELYTRSAHQATRAELSKGMDSWSCVQQLWDTNEDVRP